MPSLKPRLEKLEAAHEKRREVATERLLGLLTPDEKWALAEGLTADIEGTWDDLPADKQALALVAFEKMEAAATPAEWAIVTGGLTKRADLESTT